MDIFLISFTKYVSQPESIYIAGIHATLLAIMMACLSAYILFTFENVHTYQMRAINEAEKINEIEFIRYHHGSVTQEEVWNKSNMVKTLFEIMHGLDDVSLGIEARAIRVLGIMNAIVNQYPFCNRFFKTKDGAFGSRGIPEPIMFGDFEDVRKWVKEIDDVTGLVGSLNFDLGHLGNLMEQFSKTELFIENNETITKLALKPILSSIFTPVSLDPISSCNDFFSKLIESRKIMNKTKYFIQQTDSFREKTTSAFSFCFAFVMIGVIFVLGVIFPLAQSSVSSAYLLWIPFIFYGMIYFYLIFKIRKIIMMKWKSR